MTAITRTVALADLTGPGLDELAARLRRPRNCQRATLWSPP